MLASLYNGNVHVWNHESQTLIKTFEVTDLPGNVFVFTNITMVTWLQYLTVTVYYYTVNNIGLHQGDFKIFLVIM